MGLSAARPAHDEARHLSADGKDPALERKRGKLHALDAAFPKFADEWLANHTPFRSASDAKQVRTYAGGAREGGGNNPAPADP